MADWVAGRINGRDVETQYGRGWNERSGRRNGLGYTTEARRAQKFFGEGLVWGLLLLGRAWVEGVGVNEQNVERQYLRGFGEGLRRVENFQCPSRNDQGNPKGQFPNSDDR